MLSDPQDMWLTGHHLQHQTRHHLLQTLDQYHSYYLLLTPSHRLKKAEYIGKVWVLTFPICCLFRFIIFTIGGGDWRRACTRARRDTCEIEGESVWTTRYSECRCGPLGESRCGPLGESRCGPLGESRCGPLGTVRVGVDH